MRTTFSPKLKKAVEAQLGLVTAEQLEAAGFTRKARDQRLATGEWRKVCRTVYSVSPGELTYAQRELAALLAAGDGAALSHHSAARRLELDVPRESTIHLTIPAKRAIRRLLGTRVWRSRDLGPQDVVPKPPFRVTSVERTVIALAAVLDERDLRAALHSAVRLDHHNIWRIWRAVHESSFKHGLFVLERLLCELARGDDVPDSALESLCMDFGLGAGRTPHLHYDVWDGNRRVAEVDFAWPEVKLGLELDGWAYHGSQEAFERDRARDLELLLLGWRIVRVTWDDVAQNLQRVVDQLARAYEQLRSEQEPPRPSLLDAGGPSG